MDIHDIRQQLTRKSIYEIPLRVTFYARVSTDSDDQLNSLGNQISYYESLIKKNAAWTFVPGYIDEGLSGISTKKREDFNRMLEDAQGDLFDLIITKEISRFARNTLDSIQYTRQLLSHGVGVFFQNDNINTIYEDSELRLSIMSSIAQDELRKLSSRVKFGHRQAIKNNVVLGNSRIFGYVKDNKRLVIDEAEAVMVRELFELYATDQYSMKQIEILFWEKGYRNHNGNKIAHTTMAGIISNPKYKGYYVGNKVKVIDMFTKKQKFLPPDEWVMFKDETGEIVPAIVSEDLWDQANAVLRRRSDDVKNRQGKCNHNNLFTGKLFCAHCGVAYYRRDSKDRSGKKNSRWVCSGKIKNGKDSCDSITLYEEELKPILFEVFRDTYDIGQAMIEEYGQLFSTLSSDDYSQKKIDKLQHTINVAQKKKQKLLELITLDAITTAEFKTMTAQINADIADTERELYELQEKQSSDREFASFMSTVKSVLRKAEADCQSGTINKEFIDLFVDRILVTPQEDGGVRLDIKIFTGDTCERYLQRLKKDAEAPLHDRTGHTFKKMVEQYENSLK